MVGTTYTIPPMPPDPASTDYLEVSPLRIGIEYRKVRATGSQMGRNTDGEFALSDSAKNRLSEIVSTAFEKELAKSERFELTEETGPDVLLVWGGLLDVVSYVPPERGGRDLVFLRRVGEATLVVELRDSESNKTLARLADFVSRSISTQSKALGSGSASIPLTF